MEFKCRGFEVWALEVGVGVSPASPAPDRNVLERGEGLHRATNFRND